MSILLFWPLSDSECETLHVQIFWPTAVESYALMLGSNRLKQLNQTNLGFEL